MIQQTKNNLNYEKTMSSYRFKFEGLENPVFYYDLYPTRPNYQEVNARLDFGQGLKYKPSIHSSDDVIAKKCRQNYQRYQDIFYDFLTKFVTDNPNMKIGVVAIPSSKKDTLTCVTQVIKKVVNSLLISPNLVDLTSNLVRVETKFSAHEGGNRSILQNMDTLNFFDVDLIHKLDVVLIVDDIITTGSSFKAIKKLLTKLKFPGDIANFAFLYSMNQTAHKNYDEWNLSEKSEWNNGNCIKNKEVDAIIFDFDQTLVDTSIRNEQFEEEIFKLKVGNKDFKDHEVREEFHDFLKRYSDVYSIYDPEELRVHQEKNIPFAILSNASWRKVFLLTQTDAIQPSLYPDIWKSHYQTNGYNEEIYAKYMTSKNKKYNGLSFRYYFDKQKNMFNIPKEEELYWPKPSEKGVIKASNWLKENFDLDNNARIVGVGNTPEDIIAYHKAGIESILALWGVPEYAREYAKQNWGADHSFDTLADFLTWVEESQFNSDYLKEIENKINFEKKNETYVIYEEKQDYLWKLKKSKKNKSNPYKRLNNNSDINILKEVSGEQKASLYLLEQLLKAENIERYENLTFNIYLIIEYFKEKKHWELLNNWSKRLNKPVQVSNRLYEAYCKDDLESFEPGEGETRERNIIAYDTLKNWKACNLPWPGIKHTN